MQAPVVYSVSYAKELDGPFASSSSSTASSDTPPSPPTPTQTPTPTPTAAHPLAPHLLPYAVLLAPSPSPSFVETGDSAASNAAALFREAVKILKRNGSSGNGNGNGAEREGEAGDEEEEVPFWPPLPREEDEEGLV